MRIGIIGTGNMGTALGLGWASAGHELLFGSRSSDKASTVAARAGGSARAGDFDDAAAFGDAVLYTVRGVFPSGLLGKADGLSGKIVIDCNNNDVGNDKNPGQFRFDAPAPPVTLTERLQNDVPAARVVRAFNTIPHPVIALGRARLAPYRVSVFLCSNDARAKAVVKGLTEELGFVGVDSGGLEQARLLDGAADFLRFHIGPMRLGLFATLSLNVLDPSSAGTAS